MAERLRIGTRGSRLALWQADWVKQRLESLHPGIRVEVGIIRTKGDLIQDVPLARIGDEGLFTKELERALLDGEADLAVHSLKDLPTGIGEGLALAAITPREDPRDAFVSRDGRGLDELPAGSVIGTGSLRRRSQLLAVHPALRIAGMRGNLDTRLRKVREGGEFDGAIVAFAGLKRLGLAGAATEVLDPRRMLPAPGQGAMAVEVRTGDERVLELVADLNDPRAAFAVGCERAFLARLEGGCQLPVGALARVENGRVEFLGSLGELDGRQQHRRPGPDHHAGRRRQSRRQRRRPDPRRWPGLRRTGHCGRRVDAGRHGRLQLHQRRRGPLQL